MNYIKRLHETQLADQLREQTNRDVILVQGARQVGKTTMVEKVLERFERVFSANLERDLDLLRQIDRSASFAEFASALALYWKTPTIDQQGAVLFIDEAQESSHLGRYVRFMKEDWKQVRVILSGSSMSRIFRDDTRVPVGRFRPWLVPPLVFEEFLGAVDQPHLHQIYENFRVEPREGLIDDATHEALLKVLDSYLTVGGLPAVATSYLAGHDHRALRRALFDAQEDDFVRKSSLTDRSQFVMGLRGVANYIGMPSKSTHIHESRATADKILSALAAWNLVIEIEQKGMSSTTRHLPKRYIYDIGMAQDLRDMPFPRLSLVSTKNPALRTQLGGLFENALLINLLADQGRGGDVSGWRKGAADGVEIDFVWRQGDHTIALECKASQSVSLKHWSGIKAYLEATANAGGRSMGVLVSAAPFKVVKATAGTLVNMPLYLASGANIRRCAASFAGLGSTREAD